MILHLAGGIKVEGTQEEIMSIMIQFMNLEATKNEIENINATKIKEVK